MEDSYSKYGLKAHQINEIYLEEESPPLDTRNGKISLLLYGCLLLIILFVVMGFFITLPYYIRLPVIIENITFSANGLPVVSVFLTGNTDIPVKDVRLQLQSETELSGTVLTAENNPDGHGRIIRIQLNSTHPLLSPGMSPLDGEIVYAEEKKNFIARLF